MSQASDLRSLPDTTLNLLLYANAAWGVLLLVLWFSDHAAWAIPATYLVALWQTAVTAAWGMGTVRRYEAGEFTRAEADAGVLSVSRILAFSSILPAVVFFAQDPLSYSSWGAVASIFAVAGIVYAGAPWVVRLSNRWTHILVLTAAACALPVNATGAVSVAAAVGWFNRIVP